jgi:hypothetical protein
MATRGLDSASLKIVRATKHLDEINRIIADVTLTAGAHEIVTDANGKEIINFLIEPPLDVAILAGEIIYQLRSAIDHLAFELVGLNPGGIVLPPKWEERALFPLWITPPKNTSYNCFNSQLPGISKTAFAFIESLQPYHTGPGHHNVMAIIAKLSNIDKHRHLNAILPRAAVRKDFETARGLQSTSVVGGLKHGAEVPSFTNDRGESDPVIELKRSFLPYVTFEEIAIGAGPASLESQHVLEVCTETVNNIVIPAFIHLLKKP